MEALGQRLGRRVRVPRHLQVGEQLLQLVWDAVVFRAVGGFVVPVGVDVLTHLRRHEERLYE